MYNITKLYEVKRRYEKQLKDPKLHTSFEAVACIENALCSIDRKIIDEKKQITWQDILAGV